MSPGQEAGWKEEPGLGTVEQSGPQILHHLPILAIAYFSALVSNFEGKELETWEQNFLLKEKTNF